jgi:hypothetical protein
LLSYAAVIISPAQFRDISKQHAYKAYRRLICKLSVPETLGDTHLFAAKILSSAFAFLICPETAIVHARGAISILKVLYKEGRQQSAMLKIFGPLAYLDAAYTCIWTGEQSVGTDEEVRLSTITFEQRVACHCQLRCRGLNALRCSETVQAIAGIFWDTERTLLDLVLDFLRRGHCGLNERTSAVQQLWSSFNDPHLQENIAAII